MTEDTSPKNLRKFLESDDPATVQMGLSMAMGNGVPDNLLGLVAGLYMWHDEKAIREAAKTVFMKQAPDELKVIIRKRWKNEIRTLKRQSVFKRYAQTLFYQFKGSSLDTVDVWKPLLKCDFVDGKSIASVITSHIVVTMILEKFGEQATELLIEALGSEFYAHQECATALAKIGNRRAMDTLIEKSQKGNIVFQVLTLELLKKELVKRGLPVSGTKITLIQRLKKDLEKLE